MNITFYGEGCFKIQSGELTILTDPFEAQTGLTPPRFKADIVLKTITPMPLVNIQHSTVNSQLIHGAGEYNIKDINIFGFGLAKESAENFLKTAYLVKAEGMNLCFLGHLSETPEPAILEHLEEIDVLFIPAGGSPFIEQKPAIKLIKQIEPKIIIPSFYKIPQLKRKADDLKIFLEEFNHKEKIEPKEKLTIKKKDLADIKKTEIAVLKP
jgi:L-ascorbate metabolism protein UlaG (beta-lactamase superfamily)